MLAELFVGSGEVEIQVAERIAPHVGRVRRLEARGDDRLEKGDDFLMLNRVEQKLPEWLGPMSARGSSAIKRRADTRQPRSRACAAAPPEQIERALIAGVPAAPSMIPREPAARLPCSKERSPTGIAAGGFAAALRPRPGRREPHPPAAGILIHLPESAVQLRSVLHGFFEQRNRIFVAIGGLIRFGEQRDGFDLFGLFVHERREHRDGLVVLIVGQVQPPENHRHGWMRVAAGLFQIRDGALRVGAAIGLGTVGISDMRA